MSVDFTVIIPTYRRPRELAEALASVLGQNGVALEVLVVDDCPDGSARQPVERFGDPRITYSRNPKPSGGWPSVVRNLAWPRANGTFIHFLDDDDIVPAEHYLTVKRAFEKHPKVGLVFGRIEPFGTAPETQLAHERRFFAAAARKASLCSRFGSRLAFAGPMLFDLPLLVCSAGVVRRDCVARVGGFDPDIRLMEDSDFYVRVIRECGACYLDKVTLRYRIGTPSLMHSPNPPASQIEEQRQGRRRMQAKYRQQRGTLEFLALAALTRTFGR